MRLWKPGLRKSEKYKSFQRSCLIREFETRQKQSRQLEKQVSSILKELEKRLSNSDYDNVKKFCYNSAKKKHSEVVKNHRDKLERLNRGPIGQNYEEMKNKLIHNMSSYTLSEVEERLLCRGWDFCIENKIKNFLDFETDLELNAMKLQPHCHDSVFQSVCRQIQHASQQLMRTSKHKKVNNLSDEELAALKSLKSNKDIVICKADKGNSIVILDRDVYTKKAEDILRGEQFEQLDSDKFHLEREEELNKYMLFLYKENVIDNRLRHQLKSTCSSISVFYGLPKAHKAGYPIRPIISTIGSYQYQLSKYLAKAIRDARPQAPSYIKDSFEFVKKIKEIMLEKNKTYVKCSFDVESLYTNVPVKEAIEITLDYMYKPRKLTNVPFNREQMKKLLYLSVTDAPFRFQNKIYKQIDGVAMGNPLAPIIADLWMQKMEEKLNRFRKNKPIVWLRYVDDVFCLFTISETSIRDFHSRINKWHEKLNFTLELESNKSISFLDVLVTQDEEDKLTTSLYRKPTHTGLYMLWDSNQNRRYKLGLIRTLVIRIYRICSKQSLVERELSLLRKTLVNNGYPPHIIRRGIIEGEVIIKRMNQNQTKVSDNRKTIFFTIKYYGQESVIFASKIKKHCRKLIPNLNIQFAFKKNMSLKSVFLPILKGTDENRKNKNLVYSIPCLNCDKVYIGETSRKKETRMREHQANIRTLSTKSKLVEHILAHKHQFDFVNTKTLALENDWRKRIIKESILTSRTLGKSINEVKHNIQVVV
ncbi:unnamed protein product [Adineta ricciae]|uniref:Reverse transcriptase domain-containing protein n=1 Tax=Adineta ricciae TaxID=249248 RepID=A0A815K1M8_ADIRI|nr:unnamed protein product [Adineta ricciae]CAF1483337.1 unnamed protein product [Adineta ricciae]